MNRVLILFAHPAPHHSRVNGRLAEAVRDLPGVTFHDLYDSYPRLDIDVTREQRLLTEHPIVVFQHPIYWYSTPAILKEWQDLVLEHGWAYGKQGNALDGTSWMQAVTTGGAEQAYAADGIVEHSVRQLMLPIELTARLCGVRYLPPLHTGGTHRIEPPAIDRAATVYRRTIELLRDGEVDLDELVDLDRINHHPRLAAE